MTDPHLRDLANGLLYALVALVGKTPASDAKDRATCALEAELLPVIAHLVAPTAGIIDIETVYSEVIRTGRVALLRKIVDADNEAAKHTLKRLSHDTSIRQHLAVAEPDLLIYLAHDQQALPFEMPHILAEAVRRGDVDLFKTLAEPFHPLEPFWSSDTSSAAVVFEACGPELAPELARRLKDAIQAKSPTIQKCREDTYLLHDLKVISVLLCAGVDMSKIDSFRVEPFPKGLQDLLEGSSSAHGRLAVMSQEASLEDLIGRPAYGGSFFGIAYKEKVGLCRVENGEMIPIS